MKNLLKYFKGYKLMSVLAPVFKLLEALLELLVPLIIVQII
ncbi:MAG: ABC transporter ATP-binding protein, partial [Atopostipes suicloacalis]|nr:ABC transporter ATP-binding protein [Atopostipes suicloacalis]